MRVPAFSTPELQADETSSPTPREEKIAIFSSSTYVRAQLADLVRAFPKSVWLEPACDAASAGMCEGADAVCLFVNDDASATVIDIFKAQGVKVILLRCAGFDRVDLRAAARAGIRVLRVPKYSPNAVA